MRKSTTALLAAIATLTAAASAQAGMFPINVLLANFNLIANQNFSTTSEVIGPVLIGGNLSGSGILDTTGTAVPVAGAPAFTGYGEINVFGSNSGTWAETGVQHVFLGGTNTGGGSFLTPASLTTNYTFPGFNEPGAGSNALTFSQDIWAQLNGTTGLSHTLDGLSANGTNPGTGSSTFSCPGCTGNLVWQISATDLMDLGAALVFPSCLAGPNPSCDGVVNVTGGSFGTTEAFNTPFALQGLIFNFETATSVTISNSFEASILAPDANLESTAFIEGSVVVNSAGDTAPLGGEIHYFPFDCSDDLCTTTVPEPGSLAMLGGALVLFGARAALPARRRRG